MTKRYHYWLILIFTIIIGVSYYWNFAIVTSNNREVVFNKARSFFKQIIATRLWNSNHGGVYVPITDSTTPNIHLKDPLRDVVTTEGLYLTKINPAFMTRQISEIAELDYDLKFHITSLNPLRPENKADEWETKVLNIFEGGTDEVLEHIRKDSISEYRYMAPLITNKSCLKCHEQQGYKIGDIRGGISISFPSEIYVKGINNQLITVLLFHIFILGFGIVGILFFYRKLKKYFDIAKKQNKKLLEIKERAEESEVQLRTLINTIPDLIWLKNQEGTYLQANKRFEYFFGAKECQIIGKTDYDFVKRELADSFRENDKKAMQEGKSTINEELITFANDGHEEFLETIKTPVYDKNKNLVGILGIGRDISKRKKLEQAILIAKEEAEEIKNKALEGEESYKALLNSIGDAIYIQDYEARFIDVNSGVLNMYGYSKEEFIGNTPLFLSAPDINDMSAVFESFDKVKQGVSQVFEFWGKRKNGEIFPKTVGQYKGTYFGQDVVITVARDISNQFKTQKELIRAKEKAEESDQLKTEFINNMSHEIRTPMNGIMGFSEMLNDDDISDEKRANFIKIIQSSGQQLLNIIDDILDISRLGTKQVKVIETDVCLNDVLLELFSTFDLKAKELKIPLYLKKALSDKQSTIRIDITKLNKVLSNLLENALKFTNQGFIEFGYQLKNNEIELYVKDTGIGIEKSKHKSIFERFSQAEKDLSKKFGGLGLGLSIAKENAELLGGRIQLESKEGKGSTFFVTIPYKSVYKATDVEKAKTVPKFTILIAEDEEVNYLYIEILLKDVLGLDCIIIHVINGKEAIEACKENETIDLVLMDLKMPILNGFEATKLIKKFRPNLPIIAQTAYSTAQDKEEAIFVGCDFFMSKPIHQESFKKILDKYL